MRVCAPHHGFVGDQALRERCVARHAMRLCRVHNFNSGGLHAHRGTTCSSRQLAVRMAAAGASPGQPVILLDVMDTIVSDPFFEHMPRFFNLTFKELLAAKHPTAWVEFEKDQITQQQLFDKFFADGRQFDGQALIKHMVEHYRYIDGMPELLQRLKAAGYSLHAMSNYPTWYKLIEEKLQLSQHLDWTFVSCTGPMRGLRKPAPAAFEAVTAHLQLPAQQLVFVDDRQPNVDAAAQAGMAAILFTDAAALEQQLQQMGLKF